jgi:predicted GTPase
VQVRFLRYIKQWGKKVVFVVNKVDIFDSEADVQQVTDFVEGNARTLLGVDAATVLPVRSSQLADLSINQNVHVTITCAHVECCAFCAAGHHSA